MAVGVVVFETSNEGFAQLRCSDCSNAFYGYTDEVRCFDCNQNANPYVIKNIRFSIDASDCDSTDPQRVAEGTAQHNLALPDVPGEVIGKDAYGMTKRKMRPVHNSEISSTRKLKEMGKRAGLTLLEKPKRAIGGK